MPGPAARSSNGIMVPQPAPDDGATGPMSVDGAEGSGDTNIHIDAASGHIMKKNPDGSMTVGPISSNRKPRSDRRTFDENLAEYLDEHTLAKIATEVLEGIEADLQSRREWENVAERGADLLGVKLEEATNEVSSGTISKIKHTGLVNACLTSWANSRAELLPVGGPVKVRDDQQSEDDEEQQMGPATLGAFDNQPPPAGIGAAPVGQPTTNGIAGPLQIGQESKTQKRNDLAEAFEGDFNHYLTVIDKDYYPDFSRMLMSRALFGCQFRKIYRDPLLRRPVSRWVRGVDLIVSNEATSLTGAGRVTERIYMRQNVVKRLQVMGHWLDEPLVPPTMNISPLDRKIADQQGIDPTPKLPRDYQHTIYECNCELDEGDLQKDENNREIKYPLPYRVTVDKDSRKVLEIRRRWKKGDPDHRARRRYVKYGHVPSLGFYDWGYVHLIGNPQRGATMVEQALLDAGMLVSFPGGVMAKSPGTRQTTTEIRPTLGQFHVMNTGGLPISDFIMPWPYKEPSNTLKEMGMDLANQMKEVAGVVNLPVGEGRLSNTPVGTIMTYIETVSKVPSAVHKDDHIAQQEEFELLKELFAEDPQALWRDAKKPRKKWEVSQEVSDQDLVPASDPNVPSQTHRLMQTNMLVQLSGMQQFAGIPNQRAIYEQALRTTGWTNTGEFTNPPAPPAAAPPDPKIVVAQMKAADAEKDRQAKASLEAGKERAKSEELSVTSADKAADRDSEEKREMLKAGIARGDQHVDALKHGVGLLADHAQHADTMALEGDRLAQEHLHHTNDHIAQAADRDAQAAANPPVPDDTAGVAPPPDAGP